MSYNNNYPSSSQSVISDAESDTTYTDNSSIFFDGLSVLGGQKVCDFSGITSALFFWQTPSVPTGVSNDVFTPAASNRRPTAIDNSNKNGYSSHINNPNYDNNSSNADRVKRLEDEFNVWLGNKAPIAPIAAANHQQYDVNNNNNNNNNNSSNNNNNHNDKVPSPIITQSVTMTQAPPRISTYNKPMNSNELSNNNSNSANSSSTMFSESSDARMKALDEAKRIAKQQADIDRQRKDIPSVAITTDSSTISSSNDIKTNILGNSDLENFERLLGTDGLMAVVYLPTREGGSKSKNAIVRCERRSSTITCEISSQGQKKKLKFDVTEIMLVCKGKGMSIKLPLETDVSCIMHFNIKNKPELNLELESSSCRDAVVEGFNYLISKRLEQINIGSK